MMIKKTFIHASMVGLAAGVVYWLCKKEKTNTTVFESVNNKVDIKQQPQEETIYQRSNVVEDMYQAKDESVQAIYERHSEASEIMKDAYRNIMEDFVKDFSDEKIVNEKDKN